MNKSKKCGVKKKKGYIKPMITKCSKLKSPAVKTFKTVTETLCCGVFENTPE